MIHEALLYGAENAITGKHLVSVLVLKEWECCKWHKKPGRE